MFAINDKTCLRTSGGIKEILRLSMGKVDMDKK
jgi:hypothetical protein